MPLPRNPNSVGPDRWRVLFHVTNPLASWPRPTKVVSALLQGGTVRRGSDPDLKRYPHCTMVFTLQGEAVLQHAGATHAISPGMAFLCRFPCNAHRHYVPEGKAWRNLYLDWTGAEPMMDDLIRAHGHTFNVQRHASAARRLQQFRKHDGELFHMTAAQGAALVMLLLNEAFAAIAPESLCTPRQMLTSRALTRIHANACTGLNVDELANSLGVSPEHLCRVFKAETGQTPKSYLQAERIREACLLLETTSLSSDDIGAMLGYSTVGNFARAFKRLMGLSPHAFRQNCRSSRK